jgi:exopolysaccharide production protein ExoQ
MTASSVFIGALTFLSLLYVELTKSLVGIPRLRRHGYDFFAASLLIAYLIQSYAFNTPRTDALAVLNEDFSIGNIANIVCAAIAVLYLAFILLTGRFRVQWFFRVPYFSTSVLISVYFLTTAWSIVPLFTLYRACELIGWVCLSIYFFTRLESLVQKVTFLALYCLTFVFINVSVLIENATQGIIFSAVKENHIPAVGFSVAVLSWPTHLRLFFCIIGIATFVLAGSAASVASAIAACCIGLAFNRNIIIKSLGYIGAISTVTFMVIFLVIPNEFPEAVGFLSDILQKSTEELLNATGRYTIWNIIWDASKDNYFGSGFGSDRFVQLLANVAEVNYRVGAQSVFIMSAHDAALSAWVAAGWLGVIALFFVFINAIYNSAKCDGSQRTTTMMIVTFIILNSLTIPSLGGWYSHIWLVWIAALSVVAQPRQSTLPAPLRLRPLQKAIVSMTPSNAGPISI